MIAINGMPARRVNSMMSVSSCVLPEFDNSSAASLRVMKPKIAVARLARMDELRRRSGGGQSRRDLVPDMPALAHAADDDAAFHAHDQVDGAW